MSVVTPMDLPDDLPILQSLPPAVRAELMGSALQHSVPAGTVLFEQGDVPTFQLVVMAGSAQLFGRSTEGREVLIEAVRAPELIIPAAVVTGAPYLMGARVPEPSRFMLFQAETFRAAVAADAALAQAVIGSLARQFRRMVRQIKNLKLRSSAERVGCYILALSARQDGSGRVTLPYEKTLIASELGMTRESFSRALASLEKSSIRVEGQTIVIVDEPRLIAESRPDELIDGYS
ncbi:MAG TPA: helix-turn-helix domain-containing protein [Kaistia sp.]|nr:helix-turn-helix domain-containing protein [Kaistia sp.]